MNDITPPAQPPATVTRAFWCLWASWIAGAARAPIMTQDPQWRAMMEMKINEMSTQAGEADTESMQRMFDTIVQASLAGITLVSFLITLLILVKLKRGRNWARILCAIIGLMSVFYVLQINLTPTGILTLLNLLFGYYALYLLFTEPANSWYRAAKPVSQEWN